MAESGAQHTEAELRVLVIGSEEDDWRAVFREVGGDALQVVRCSWEELQVAVLGDSRAQCSIKGHGVFYPEVVLVRKLTRGLAIGEDHRNKLFGLMYAGVVGVNSLSSIARSLDRPPVMAALKRLQETYGARFPLIDMHYYSSYRVTAFTPEPPFVAKVGFAEAGYGKLLVRQGDSTWKDFVGCFATHGEYITAEAFYDKEYDIRVQKIGPHVRGYIRRSSNWKGNVGSSVLEEVAQKDIPRQWRFWAEKAATIFGGLDILTVDAVHMASGEEIILEINDTASGLYGPNKAEDMRHIAELVLSKMDSEEGRAALTASRKKEQLAGLQGLEL